MKYTIPWLKQDEELKAFVVEVKNKFQLMSTEETDYPHVERKWNQINYVYCNTENNSHGYMRITDKACLSTNTWRRIEERKTIMLKILNTKSKIIQKRL